MLKPFNLILKIIILSGILLLVIKTIPPTLRVTKNWINTSVCEIPTTYRIGAIDENFDINQDQLLESVESAAKIWEDGYGKPMFLYDPSSALTINLMYDERHKTLTSIKQIEEDFGSRASQLDENIKEYERRLTEIKNEARKLNESISYWNSVGGAPKDEYENLIKKQEEVNQKIDEINAFGESINLNVDRVNQQADTLNKNIGWFNSLLSDRPEMGTYKQGLNEINIYFYSSREDLVSVLAHEMGHALGLDHIEKENALMSPVSSTQNTLTQDDVNFLNDFCKENNRLDLVKSTINNKVYVFLSGAATFLSNALASFPSFSLP